MQQPSTIAGCSVNFLVVSPDRTTPANSRAAKGECDEAQIAAPGDHVGMGSGNRMKQVVLSRSSAASICTSSAAAARADADARAVRACGRGSARVYGKRCGRREPDLPAIRSSFCSGLAVTDSGQGGTTGYGAPSDVNDTYTVSTALRRYVLSGSERVPAERLINLGTGTSQARLPPVSAAGLASVDNGLAPSSSVSTV